jgi:hypothetical protein
MSHLTLIGAGTEVFGYQAIIEALMEGKEYPQPMLYNARFVMDRVAAGEWQLWFAFEVGEDPHLMMLTQVNTFPGGKVLDVELVVGRGVFDIFARLPNFEDWCRFEKISIIRSTPRPEVAELLSRHGWTKSCVQIYKELERVH